MAAEYYTAESVRNQILRIGKIDNAFSPPSFSDDWKYCPCHLETIEHCVNGRCVIKLGIFFNDPNIGRFPIEIIYLKGKKDGFIPVDQMKLRTLIDKKIINRKMLKSVFF